MSLFVRNNGSTAVTLVGTVVSILPGQNSNVTSELRGLSIQQYTALEVQRCVFPVDYVWSDGEAEFPIRPLQDTNDYSTIGVKTILLRQMQDLSGELQRTHLLLAETRVSIREMERKFDRQIQISRAADREFSRGMFLAGSNALAGDVVINLGDDDTITAAELNAAAAGTIERNVPVVIESANNTAHLLCSATLDVTPGYTPIATGTGAAPTVDATVTVDKGKALKVATFITDAGATKTYEVGDTITVQVSFSGGVWLGNTVTAVTKTWTVT